MAPAREAVPEAVGVARELVEGMGVDKGEIVDCKSGLRVGREVWETASTSVVGLPTTEPVGIGAVPVRLGEGVDGDEGVESGVKVAPASEAVTNGVAQARGVEEGVGREEAVRGGESVPGSRVSVMTGEGEGLGVSEEEVLGEEEAEDSRLTLDRAEAVKRGV